MSKLKKNWDSTYSAILKASIENINEGSFPTGLHIFGKKGVMHSKKKKNGYPVEYKIRGETLYIVEEWIESTLEDVKKLVDNYINAERPKTIQ